MSAISPGSIPQQSLSSADPPLPWPLCCYKVHLTSTTEVLLPRSVHCWISVEGWQYVQSKIRLNLIKLSERELGIRACRRRQTLLHAASRDAAHRTVEARKHRLGNFAPTGVGWWLRALYARRPNGILSWNGASRCAGAIVLSRSLKTVYINCKSWNGASGCAAGTAHEGRAAGTAHDNR